MPLTVLPPYLANYPTFPSMIGQNWPVKRSPQWNNIRQRSTSGKDYLIGLYSTPLRSWDLTYTCLNQRQKYSSIDLAPSTDALVDWDNMIGDDEAALEGFYNYCGGGLTPFYFSDPFDHAVSLNQFGIGDGTTTQFQLTRNQAGFVETIQSPSGTPRAAAFWSAGQTVTGSGYAITPSNNWINRNGQAPYFIASGSGITGNQEPNWNSIALGNGNIGQSGTFIPGTTITDNGITWTCQGPSLVIYIMQSGDGQTPVPQMHTAYSVSATGLITFLVPPPDLSIVSWTGEFYWACRFDKDIVEFSADFNRLWVAKTMSFSLWKQ